jgi:hypothetical protein
MFSRITVNGEPRLTPEEVEEERKERSALDRAIAAFSHPTKEPIPAKVAWNGTAVDFADWVYEAWSQKHIVAETEYDAYAIFSKIFCQKNGAPFKPRSLEVSRKKRKDLKG